MTDPVEAALHAVECERLGFDPDPALPFTPNMRRHYMVSARAFRAALEKAGYAVVPVRPTEAMENAAVNAAADLAGWLTNEAETNAIWTAMLGAAGVADRSTS